MKLRCVHNSIRIRIRKSELEQLDKKGIITETISVGGTTMFAYALAVDEMRDEVNAELADNLLAVHVPLVKAQKWITSNQVGIEVTKALDNGEQLHILIEKDFPCTDRVDEDKSDTFTELVTKKPDVC